jgi:hypothetical protein
MVNAMRVLCTAIRSYLVDLLPHAPPGTNSEVAIFASRLLGCATIYSVAILSIRHAGPVPAARVFPFALLVLAVAILIGNLVKELGILVGGIVLNWRGLEFRRSRSTLSGARMTEVYRADGTWDRYIRDSAETIHEWLDLKGECHREMCGQPNRKTS